MTVSKNQKTHLWPLALLCLLLLAVVLFYNPFPSLLSRRIFYLGELSPRQKANISLAAKAVDGTVLEAGQDFSFNALVGPRLPRRGYQFAPAYLEDRCPDTAGGGICLLSSALYQDALETGLLVFKRVPHVRTVNSVAAGLDATVWYDKADLAFQNTLSHPLKIQAKVSDNQLVVAIFGSRRDKKSAFLQRIVKKIPGRSLEVTVYRTYAGQTSRISRDIYRLSGTFAKQFPGQN